MGTTRLSVTSMEAAKAASIRRSRASLGGVLIAFGAMTLLCNAGCQSTKEASSNNAPVQGGPAKQTQDTQVKAIQDNPQMPDNAKKAAIAAIQANSQHH